MGTPESRNEAILQSMIDGTEYTAPPQSRIESLLIQLDQKLSGQMLDGDDLDDIVTSGFYAGDNCTNAPFAKFTLIVVGYSESYASQICFDLATGAAKTRSDINGIWTAWNSLSGSALLVDAEDNSIVTNNDDSLITD